jgi:hypothetical protein
LRKKTLRDSRIKHKRRLLNEAKKKPTKTIPVTRTKDSFGKNMRPRSVCEHFPIRGIHRELRPLVVRGLFEWNFKTTSLRGAMVTDHSVKTIVEFVSFEHQNENLFLIRFHHSIKCRSCAIVLWHCHSGNDCHWQCTALQCAGLAHVHFPSGTVPPGTPSFNVGVPW